MDLRRHSGPLPAPCGPDRAAERRRGASVASPTHADVGRCSCARCVKTRPTPRSTATGCSCGRATSAGSPTGIYSWLPLGIRVLHKVSEIVRQEMDRAGAQEVLAADRPAARALGADRPQRRTTATSCSASPTARTPAYCLSPTAEEVVTTLVAQEYGSYRDLPVNLYQINWKYRDEIRPRFGLLRSREFLMKDAYSFDLDPDGPARELPADVRRVPPRVRAVRAHVPAGRGAVGRDGRRREPRVHGGRRGRRGRLRVVQGVRLRRQRRGRAPAAARRSIRSRAAARRAAARRRCTRPTCRASRACRSSSASSRARC